jgi:hypothetical protein
MDCQDGPASERVAELAPGRSLQFIGLNSALVCMVKDEEGELLLGAHQRVLPVQSGQELVALCHHPLRGFEIPTTLGVSGGHFAAMEQPELMLADLRVFIATVSGERP